MGYMHHQRCEIDRRSVRVRLTDCGRHVRGRRRGAVARHADGLEKHGVLGHRRDRPGVNHSLKRIERLLADQIRYIY